MALVGVDSTTVWTGWKKVPDGARLKLHMIDSRPAPTTPGSRSGLAYAHGVMVCGAIVVAVGIEEIITFSAVWAKMHC